MRKTFGGEPVDDAVRLAELIIEVWADRTLRQRTADIVDFLADLIPDLTYHAGRYRVLQGDENRRLAGYCVTADVIQIRRLLQLLLYPIRDLQQSVANAGTPP